MPDPVASVVDGLSASPKYRDLAPEILERTARWAIGRRSRPSEALKVARRKLHQAFGAYLDAGSLRALERQLDRLDAGADVAGTCRAILSLHRSSAERLDRLEAFYAAIRARAGPPRHILDVAAGLNGFALPFMDLPPSTRYTAVEANRRVAEATGRLLGRLGRPGESLWADVLGGIESRGADLALVLKTLPCLDRQEAGASLALLRRLADVPLVVVTYPARSLGGREKGMRETYRRHVEALAARVGRDLAIVPFEDELVAILRRAETRPPGPMAQFLRSGHTPAVGQS